MEKKNSSTIKDVAKEAEVSITTVSRVLNNNYPVSKEKRERVENAIKKLNFNPNIIARSLVSKRTQVLGIVVPSITNLFFTMVVKGIEKFCTNINYTMLLVNSYGDCKNEIQCIRDLISRQVDGIIVMDPCTDNMKNRSYDEFINHIPIVFINGYNEGLNYNFVISDEKQGTIDALNYLFNNGHKDIAFIRGSRSYSYDIKEIAYRDFLKEHNIKFSEQNIINIGEGNSVETVNNAFEAVASNIKEGAFYTAYFACNDLMAVGVLNACKSMKLDVPSNVSIIGFDNIMVSEISTPKITTVDQKMRELGTEASRMLIDIIDGKINWSSKKTNNTFIVKTELILRDSCSLKAL